MARSVLEAIREGDWSFEPAAADNAQPPATSALPGTGEKLRILAERARQGLPLWHPADRLSFDDSTND